MITVKELIRRAMQIYDAKDGWNYVQGGLGEYGYSDRIRNLYTYFWNKKPRTNSMTRPYFEWVKDHSDQRCTDCSNFINVLLQYPTNYYSVWSLGQLPDVVGIPLIDSPVGTVLWKEGHVGLVVEKGKVMDFYKYEETCRISPIDPHVWVKAVYLEEVEYETPTVIKAESAIREWTVGDTVTADDLIVKGYFENEGWKQIYAFNYTPGIIVSEKCQIAVTYDDMVEYIGIKAKSTGKFYGVVIPCKDASSALETQLSIIGAYPDAAIYNQ